MFHRVKTWSFWTKGDANERSGAEGQIAAQTTPETRRNQQKNLKASPACIAAFAHLAKLSHMSEAALFEDMVAQRWEELRGLERIK